MEYNENTDKVIGLIEKDIPDKHNEEILSAKIKICGLIYREGTIKILSANELKTLFPPSGYVFEYNFFSNYHSKFKIGEVVEFWAEENRYAKENQDKFKIKNYNPDLKNFGINARKLGGFKKNGFATNLDAISLDDNTDGTFYGFTDKYIIGKLRTKNGKVEPALYHKIQMWDLDDDKLLSIDGKHRLIQEPQGDFLVLDCMNEKQLFEWFRDFLKQIQPDYVNLLDHNGSWRVELPKLFSSIDSEKLEVDKIRLKRIEEKFNLLELSRSDIKTLVDNSENLKRTFINSLEKHKEELKENYQEELEQYKALLEQQKSLLDNDIITIQNEKEAKKIALAQQTELLKETKDQLTKLKENKERIIQDFSIIKEVLHGQTNKDNFSKEEINSFIVEEIKNSNSDNIETLEEFEAQLKYCLFNNSLNPKYAKKIIDTILSYSGIFVKDIRIGVVIAEATANAKYLIQQVEPDWLHFRDFWKNGLSEIWNSAHNSPDTFHFLLLEDINMSAPECYCRPLLDVLNGTRKKIPFAQTSLPTNLKILATIASFNEPEIGLPIHKNTFQGWGAIGFRGNIYENIESISKQVSKSLSTSLFYGQIIDEFNRDNISNDVNTELDNIFEV